MIEELGGQDLKMSDKEIWGRDVDKIIWEDAQNVRIFTHVILTQKAPVVLEALL